MSLPKLRLSIAVTICLALGCQAPSDPSDHSETLGKKPFLSHLFSRPKEVSAKTFSEFLKKLSKPGMMASSSSKNSKKIARQQLGISYIRETQALGGIPREQGEEALKSILSPKSTACDGGSCSQVFGLSDKEVEDFMNELMAEAAASKSLSNPEAIPRRSKIISSLAPSGAFTTPKEPWDYIGYVIMTNPEYRPQRLSQPLSIVTQDMIDQSTKTKFLDAIYSYTSSDSGKIRHVEVHSDVELIKQGYHIEDIKILRDHALVINNGLKKLPKVSQVVFRGMADVSAENLALWAKNWHEKLPMYLSAEQRPALTSASWNLEIAERFTKSFRSADGHVHFNILMELRDHKGIAIENISIYPSECEVLIPSHQQFIIEKMAPMADDPLTILVTMRGVNSASSINMRMMWARQAA